MDDRLEALLHLQAIDNEIEQVEEQQRRLPLRARAAEQELARATETLQALKRDTIAAQKEADARELELKSNEAVINKLQGQRLAVKSNREYTALTAEIGGVRAENARLEDQILVLYTKVEQAQKAHQAQSAEVERLTRERDAILAQTREEIAALRERLAGLRQAGRAARERVPAAALALYTQLRARLAAAPLVPVREEVCTGCNMAVSSQTISLLRLGRDLIQCLSCTRILYLDGADS